MSTTCRPPRRACSTKLGREWLAPRGASHSRRRSLESLSSGGLHVVVHGFPRSHRGMRVAAPGARHPWPSLPVVCCLRLIRGQRDGGRGRPPSAGCALPSPRAPTWPLFRFAPCPAPLVYAAACFGHPRGVPSRRQRRVGGGRVRQAAAGLMARCLITRPPPHGPVRAVWRGRARNRTWARKPAQQLYDELASHRHCRRIG